MPSASSKTFCSTSLTCFSSFEMVTTPTTDLCHVSWCSSSATATLKSLLSLSFRLRNTCRLSFGDVQLEGEQADWHLRLRGKPAVYFLPAGALACPAASAALILVTLKHSRTSPTLMSLKLATPAPHSKPVRTSLASSLNRFSELSFDV